MKLPLTDKFKEDFEDWYWDNYGLSTYVLSKSMIFGVIQDFADEKGIDLDVKIGVDTSTDIKDGFDYLAFDFSGSCKTRKEARELAIKKFNKLYNERVK